MATAKMTAAEHKALVEKNARELAEKMVAEGRAAEPEKADGEINARASAVATPASASRVETDGERKANPKYFIGRCAMAMAIGRNDRAKAVEWLERRDPVGARALTTLNFDDGGALIHDDMTDDVLPALRETGTVRGSGVPLWPLPNGNLTLPRVGSGSTMGWIGESQVFGKTQPDFEAAQLQAKKVGGIIPFTAEMLEDTSGRIERIAQQDGLAALGLAEEEGFLNGLGTSYTPLGIYNMGGNAVSSAVVTAAGVKKVLRGALVRMREKVIPAMNLQWWVHPQVVGFLDTLQTSGLYPFSRGLEKGEILGVPFHETSTIARDSVARTTAIALVDVNSLAIGDAAMLEIKQTDTGSYTVNGSLRSVFENDEVLVRFRRRTDIVSRRGATPIEIINTTNWDTN